jgi:DNA-binding NarL/FixJ family response regulator
MLGAARPKSRASLQTKPMKRLTPKEIVILRLLASGKTYEEIRFALSLSQACLHTHCHHVRQKTGIVNTKNRDECYAFQRGFTNPDKVPLLATKAQKAVLALLAQGKSYAEIANTLGIGIQTVQNHASTGAKRLGIHRAGPRRTELIREKLSTPKPDAMADEMF